MLLLTCCYRQDQSPACLFACLFVCLLVCLFVCLFVCLLVCMRWWSPSLSHPNAIPAHTHTHTHTPLLCCSLLDPATDLDGDVLLKKTFVSGDEVTAFISEVTGEGGSMEGT